MNLYFTKHQFKINDIDITFPTNRSALEQVLGKARVEKSSTSWQLMWDELGISASCGTMSEIFSLLFHLADNPKTENKPKYFFSGTCYVDGQLLDLNAPLENDGPLALSRRQHEGSEPFGYAIGKNLFYQPPADKYEIKPLDEPVLSLTDFNFKLAIIQVLMYEKGLLQPKFDIYEFIDSYKGRKIDEDEERFEPIPEVMDYFKELPIPVRFTKDITEILQDGGNEIYLNTCLECEGYEDFWDITSAADAKLFPNLKKAILCYAKPTVLDELKAMGVEARWL